MFDTLVWYGDSELKAISEDRIGGYLVRFGSPEQTDSSRFRDYFTRETDFWAEFPAKAHVIYHHGLDATLKARRLGVVELKVDEVGVWAEAQLKIRDQYEQKIVDLVRAGKLGWSSGSASHLVHRDRQSNGANKITSWPIVEASLTPAPAEPRAQAVSLKSLTDEPDSGESFVAACLKSVADLEAAARRFAKVGATKRAAIQELRDALDGLLKTSEPGQAPADVAAVVNRWVALEARLNGVL